MMVVSGCLRVLARDIERLSLKEVDRLVGGVRLRGRQRLAVSDVQLLARSFWYLQII